ncbi:hypothetical protein JVH1_37945 [Rhodococcus sp. JVH1]|nr:protein kinase/ transcriptional regulator, LuxR family domain protein [Rhodococcus sp. JVH1]
MNDIDPFATQRDVSGSVGAELAAAGFEDAQEIPEVVAGKPPSPAADVYGLGATFFAALTGHAAFERRSGEQLFVGRMGVRGALAITITSQFAPNG